MSSTLVTFPGRCLLLMKIAFGFKFNGRCIDSKVGVKSLSGEEMFRRTDAMKYSGERKTRLYVIKGRGGRGGDERPSLFVTRH